MSPTRTNELYQRLAEAFGMSRAEAQAIMLRMGDIMEEDTEAEEKGVDPIWAIQNLREYLTQRDFSQDEREFLLLCMGYSMCQLDNQP